MRKKTRVILVTDGDGVAQKAVESAAWTLGLRVISRSGGNPTPLTGEELVELAKTAHHDPVLIMVDDRGKSYKAQGEHALEVVARHPDIEVLGVVAVASNTWRAKGAKVNLSITSEGEVVPVPVDKLGNPQTWSRVIRGDTVDVLEELNVPLVIGIGDVGKMEGADLLERGAPITVRAIREILERSKIAIDDRAGSEAQSQA